MASTASVEVVTPIPPGLRAWLSYREPIRCTIYGRNLQHALEVSIAPDVRADERSDQWHVSVYEFTSGESVYTTGTVATEGVEQRIRELANDFNGRDPDAPYVHHTGWAPIMGFVWKSPGAHPFA